MKCRYHLLGIIFLNYFSTTLNADWPQFLGPQRNGIADKSTQIKIPNATGEFSQLWKISAGDGHAGPVVVDQKVLLHHRYGDEEILEAFDSNTGKSIWKIVTHADIAAAMIATLGQNQLQPSTTEKSTLTALVECSPAPT